ncbi:MAG: AarF/ABC1/UbiB kinase family protein [Myxococcales bacterium]|nr:AarF/ABC1/UbiB kinase family protein [Myxococcales bacterium]
MRAAVRLLRALRVFAVIFLSYLWMMSWARLWPKRYDQRAHWGQVHRANARRMYRGFVRLRGVYIKLGQILSIMGTFLPKEYTEELEGLQDEVPPQPYRTISKSFVKSFGKHPTEVFKQFSHTPIAAASLGQVHEAMDEHGRRLAVKILYPNVATVIRVDLTVLGWALRVYRAFVPVQQIERVHTQLTDMLSRETDLANEARCIERMAKNFEGDPDVLFPTVVHEWTSSMVLTMSFMDGVKIKKKSALQELGLDPYAVATKLTQVFYKQLFVDRFFHADPHPGNFFVQRGPQGQVRLVILDLGSASEVADNLADGMIDILRGMMMRDDNLVIRGIETMGFVAEGGDRELLERTTRRYFEKLLNLNLSDFGKISSNVVEKLSDSELRREELRELMRSIAYPEGWFYVERAVVIMFGLSATLAPKLNTIQVGFPYIMKFMAEAQARLAGADLRQPSSTVPREAEVAARSAVALAPPAAADKALGESAELDAHLN